MSMELTEKQLEWLDSQPDLPDADKPENRCALIWIGGSHAYGLADKNSDVDVRAATMPTMRQFLSLHDYGEKHMPDSDMVVRSYLKVARMLRDANPNMVELVNLPIDCFCTATTTVSACCNSPRSSPSTRNASQHSPDTPTSRPCCPNGVNMKATRVKHIRPWPTRCASTVWEPSC